jgi:hypothetical protein
MNELSLLCTPYDYLFFSSLSMKILHSFDTKLDEKELLDAINRHGKGNALLIKRHWIFLVAPLAWLLLAIAVF